MHCVPTQTQEVFLVSLVSLEFVAVALPAALIEAKPYMELILWLLYVA